MLPNTIESIEQLARLVIQKSQHSTRMIIAVAGAPGSGKSTLAEKLQTEINQWQPESALFCQIVAMDGFHLDNATLQKRNLLEVKGSPDTFDVSAFTDLLKRIRANKEPVSAPIFDRLIEEVIPNVIAIELSTKIVIVEGNYLLLHQSPWSDLQSLFDLSVFIHVSTAKLEARLLQRWLDYGFSHSQAEQKVSNNDLVNAKLVTQTSFQADIDFQS